jgi:vesicle-associated membrane protein 7
MFYPMLVYFDVLCTSFAQSLFLALLRNEIYHIYFRYTQQYSFRWLGKTVEDGICFLCMSDELNKHRIPYAFLNDIQDNFYAKYGRELAQRAIAFSMNEEFSLIIKSRMEYYNMGGTANNDSIGRVQGQIDQVKDVMVQNIEKVLERGEKIELLVDKTDKLNQQAFKFQKNSRTLRRTLWWKKVRSWVCWSTAIILGLYFVAAFFLCGGLALKECRSQQ